MNSRLEELRGCRRCEPGAGSVEDLNGIGGLLELLDFAKPSSVIEIGAGRGISTEVFLLRCGRVVTIDPSPDEMIERLHAYPSFRHVKDKSPQAIHEFSAGEFEMSYIDGDHEYGSVVADITACQRVSSKWIAGHDFGMHGVASAVRNLLEEPLKIFSDGSWIVNVNPLVSAVNPAKESERK